MTEKYTALFEQHKKAGASFTDFGGWQMPLKYASELAEHHAVRNAAGLFDLSHMGEVWVTGPDAAAFLDYALAGKLSAVAVGKAKYSLICDADGGIIDDLISYRRPSPEEGVDQYLVVPNAGNAAVVARELLERAADFNVAVEDASADTSLVAVQGPAAEEILLKLVPTHQHPLVTELKYYAAVEVGITVNGAVQDLLVARTGYTGEDGFELYVANPDAVRVWDAIMTAGAGSRGEVLTPIGLGARDTRRLEARFSLYGNDIDETTGPIEAGLGWTCKLDKDFVGRDKVAKQKADGPKRRIAGLIVEGGVARHGHDVVADGKAVGKVTSGTYGPTVAQNIALAYVPTELSKVGTALAVRIREKDVPATVVKTPFYRRAQ